MDEVLHLLEQYRDDVEAEFPPQSIEDVLESADSGTTRIPPAPRRRRWVAALAAGAIALALLGGVAILGLLIAQEDTTVTTQPTPTTSPPTPTTSPPTPTTTLVDPGPARLMTWERVPAQASLGAGDVDHEYLIHTVIEGGPGLIAAGRVRPAGGIYWYDLPAADDQAAVWTSDDGISWDRISADGSGLDGPGGYSIHDLTTGGPGYVAVGAAVEDGSTGPAIWVSEDALVWTRVYSAGFIPGDELTAVAASDDGIVAVGGSWAPDIWFSPDGWDWQRVETPPSAYLNDVAYADWGFVAVGRDYEEVQDDSGAVIGTNERPIVAISPDGVTWEYLDLPESPMWFGAVATAIAATGEEVVVGGSYQTSRGTFDVHPAFWRSDEGSDWDRSFIPRVSVSGMFEPAAGIRSLAITDSGTIAVGGWWPQFHSDWSSVPHPAARFDPGFTLKMRNAVWVSPNPGEQWREDPRGETFALEKLERQIGTTMGFDDVAVLDGALVGVSTHAGEAAVWIGEWND